MGELGRIVGALAGAALDPVILLPALLVGAIAGTAKRFWLWAPAGGAAVHAATVYGIWNYRESLGFSEALGDYAVRMAPTRIGAFVAVAAIAYLIAKLAREISRRTR